MGNGFRALNYILQVVNNYHRAVQTVKSKKSPKRSTSLCCRLLVRLYRLMPTRDTDEEFEFLLNLLASDGADHDPPLGATGSQKADVDRGPRIQRGSDGRVDLGQVKAFYERKNATMGPLRDSPGLTDHSRNHSGLHFFFFIIFFP